jgi:DNA-binding beta-propeller fold protein YncE
MIARIRKFTILSLAFVAISLFFNNNCIGQDTLAGSKKGGDKWEVKWLYQWPAADNKIQKKDTKQQIKDFIFGKKKQDLVRPVSLLTDAQNSMWILDQESKSVFQVTNNVCTFPHYIEKKNKNFASLVDICNFKDNQILITDSYTNKIFLINNQKKECRVLNDSLKLNKVTGTAYSPLTKEIWASETDKHRIVILNEKGEIIKKIGSRGTARGEFNFPTHIWIDKKGNAYVVDAMNFRVQVFNKGGDVISMFGKNGDATGYFASPKGIATDSYGNIYIVDALFHVVQVFDIYGNFLYKFGSQGQGEGQFWMPSGIYIDDTDKIFIADCYNSRIQVFQLITGGQK